MDTNSYKGTKKTRLSTLMLIVLLLTMSSISFTYKVDSSSSAVATKLDALSTDVNLDDDASMWGVFTEGNPTWAMDNAASPSLDGRSLRCAITGGAPYSTVHCYRNLAADPASNHFVLTMSFFYQPVSTFNNAGGPSVVQALEFTMNQWHQGLRYEWALQWDNVDTGAPKWRYWGRETPGGPLTWIDLGITGSLAGKQWHTFELDGEKLLGNVHYKRFMIDGQEHLLDISVSPASTVEPDKLAVAIQLDGNSTETPYKVFLDQVTFNHLACADADTVGVFRPNNGLIYLKNCNTTGYADIALNYGQGGDYPIAGDWNGDGVDTIGVYRNGAFYLRNSNTVGYADVTFPFGSPGDQPIAGDWDGDGIDTIGVYRSSTFTFYLRNSNAAGPANMIFSLGIPGDLGIAGDWTGKGYDTVGVFRPSNGVIFLKNTNATGYADIAINYGQGGDKPVTGDWNNDGIDTIGVLRGNHFYLRNSNTVGYSDVDFALGIPGDLPIAGNWDGKP